MGTYLINQKEVDNLFEITYIKNLLPNFGRVTLFNGMICHQSNYVQQTRRKL